MSKVKKDTLVVGMSVQEKKELKQMAKERNLSMSGLGRMALDFYKEEGCNEPLIMQQFIELVQKLNDLENTIPEKEYESIQNNIGNIMKLKGGK